MSAFQPPIFQSSSFVRKSRNSAGLYFPHRVHAERSDQRNYIVSNEKIEATGFMPAVSIADGIAELLKGYSMLSRNTYTNL